MKRIIPFFTLFIAASCSLNDYSTTAPSFDLSQLIITKGPESLFQEDYSINENDINVYLKYNAPKNKSVIDITPISIYDNVIQDGYKKLRIICISHLQIIHTHITSLQDVYLWQDLK